MVNQFVYTGLFVFIIYIIVTKIVSCRQETASKNTEIDACISRGVAYFKEVGAYPTLTTTGENAEDVARERCNRTTTAFQ